MPSEQITNTRSPPDEQIELSHEMSESGESKPRPLFIYGTLCALPLLAWTLTGDATNLSDVSRLIQPAKVYGYAWFSLQDYYPAAIKHEPHSSIDGYLLTPETTSQRKRLDAFEGEAYEPVPVDVVVLGPGKTPQDETVEADIYLWVGDANALTTTSWDLETFQGGNRRIG